MIESYKEFAFRAARSLPPHAALYGQSFKVRLVLRGDPDPVYGWPANFNDLEGHVHRLLAQLDRRHLNEIEGLTLPSTENIARWIWDQLRDALPTLARVSVSRGLRGGAEGCVYPAGSDEVPRRTRLAARRFADAKNE